MNIKNKTTISYSCAFLTVVLWGTLATVSKILLNSLDAMFVLAFICDVSAVILLIYNLIKGNLKKLKSCSVKDLLSMCVLGFIGFFLYNFFYLLGIDVLPSQQAMIINYLWPAMIIVFSCIFLKEKVTAKKFIAVALSFAGITIVAINGNFEVLFGSDLKGIIYCLCAAVCYGFYATLNKKQKYDKEIAIMVAFAVSGVVASVIALFSSGIPQMSTGTLFGLIYDAVFVNAIGYTSWMIALEYGNTAVVSNLAYLTPFISLVVAKILLNEEISLFSTAGLLLIIAGIVLQFFGNKNPETHNNTEKLRK